MDQIHGPWNGVYQGSDIIAVNPNSRGDENTTNGSINSSPVGIT